MTLILLAYIDPNAGGPIAQLLVPMFVGVGAVWVLFKEKIRTALKHFRRFRATE